MSAGRRLSWRRSAGLTPSTLNATDSEKNAMPNDIANRGCRTVPQIGWTDFATQAEAHACARSQRETLAGALTLTRRRWVSTPVVDARILLTRPAGGSTSVSSFSQLRPASTSANSGPQAEQLRA